VDDGVEAGQEIPIYYDPMLAKLVVHAPDREAAIARLLRAIDEYAIGGVSTTLDFGRFAVDHPTFRSGNFDTHFVRDHYVPEALHRSSTEALDVLSLLATGASSGSSRSADRPVRSPRSSGWVARSAV
jgi:acetyl/propionyl-CoA carboxylase alpha subunit